MLPADGQLDGESRKDRPAQSRTDAGCSAADRVHVESVDLLLDTAAQRNSKLPAGCMQLDLCLPDIRTNRHVRDLDTGGALTAADNGDLADDDLQRANPG